MALIKGAVFPACPARREPLEDDPAKACPGLDPGWTPLCRKRSFDTRRRRSGPIDLTILI
jgi:hypothetical protein